MISSLPFVTGSYWGQKYHSAFCCDHCVHVWYRAVQITYCEYITRKIFANYCGCVPCAVWNLMFVTDWLLCELATVVTSCCVRCWLSTRSLSNFQAGCYTMPTWTMKPMPVCVCVHAVIWGTMITKMKLLFFQFRESKTVLIHMYERLIWFLKFLEVLGWCYMVTDLYFLLQYLFA